MEAVTKQLVTFSEKLFTRIMLRDKNETLNHGGEPPALGSLVVSYPAIGGFFSTFIFQKGAGAPHNGKGANAGPGEASTPEHE
jgi:hypothetical protein